MPRPNKSGQHPFPLSLCPLPLTPPPVSSHHFSFLAVKQSVFGTHCSCYCLTTCSSWLHRLCFLIVTLLECHVCKGLGVWLSISKPGHQHKTAAVRMFNISALFVQHMLSAAGSAGTGVQQDVLPCRNLAAELGLQSIQAFKMDATTAVQGSPTQAGTVPTSGICYSRCLG